MNHTAPEQEAIRHLEMGYTLAGLSAEYQNKEFILKYLNEYKKPLIADSLIYCGNLKIDYDIALASFIQRLSKFKASHKGLIASNMYRALTSFLSEEEKQKLKHTLEYLFP